ncbi:MAG: hypothetical protein K2G91_11080, partial [Prevotella sp.]|nr:hypothetical protein [Prevotella sp.]
NCIYGSGGNLCGTNIFPYVRGVKSTNNDSAIYWTDPDDLKLSVLINGNREFLDKQEYDKRKDEIDTIEGVVIIAGGEKFALRLNNEQTDRISSIKTAMNLYGSVMPTANQGKIISAKWSDINSSISKFGGVRLDPSAYYYTSSTSSPNYNYTNCIYGSGGNLYNTNISPYVRGVTNFK